MRDIPLPRLFNRVDPARNVHRFYALSIEADLFGAVLLVRRWGRIGTHGQSRVEVCGSADLAVHRFSHWSRVKRRRGYEPVPEADG